MREFAIFHYNEYLFKLKASTTDGALDVARERIKAKIEVFNEQQKAKAEEAKAKGEEFVWPQPPFKLPNRAEGIDVIGGPGEMLPWQQQLKKQQQAEAQKELAALIAEKEGE